MARPTNTAVRRRQIVQALASVMMTKGFAGATIVEIAHAAGLAPGLVHYHFADKHQILLNLCNELASTIRKRYEARMHETSTAGDRLAGFIDAHVAFGDDADQPAVTTWSAVAAEALSDEAVRTVYQRHIENELKTLAELITESLVDQGRRVHDVTSKAAVVLSAIEGAFRLGTSAPGSTPPGFASSGIKSMAEALIKVEPLEKRPT